MALRDTLFGGPTREPEHALVIGGQVIWVWGESAETIDWLNDAEEDVWADEPRPPRTKEFRLQTFSRGTEGKIQVKPEAVEAVIT